jgi:hypothetical protein
VCGFSAVHSQDLTMMEELVLQKKSLQDQLRSVTDSVSRLVEARNAEVKTLREQVREFGNDTAYLHKKIRNLGKKNADLHEELDKKNIEKLKTGLQQKADSIALLKQMIKGKDSEVAAAKQDGLNKAAEQYRAGQQNAYSGIGRSYHRNFDDLIKSSTRLSIERDLTLVGSDTVARQKLHDLQKYFAAQHILSEQYSEQKVKNAQSQAESIEQSESVKNLIDKLGKYKLCSDALKITIGKILVIDRVSTANDDYTQNVKLQDILSELSWYFRNYSSDFTDYPYLSDIALDIMKRKQRDANTDIKDLLNKL